MQFAERLKDLRYEKGVTITQVARNCKVSIQCISSLEMGKRNPTGSTISMLADYFGVSADYLLGRIDDPLEIVPIQSTVPTVPGLGEISPMEKELITRFRKLPEETQDYILGITRNLTK